ncbi:unnamed protein product [Brachionus calyciflorus]|uniref:Uncharacterized protein n=1 Tax=Brachionus calyciflorus TaxID=104777 RepID=A0A814LVJ5_9BILA|nr:unnamed protein product [Brachionus calyciflorus]
MKNKADKKKGEKADILAMNERKLHKASNLCGNLKKTRVIAKKPQKVVTNLKKIDLVKKEVKSSKQN